MSVAEIGCCGAYCGTCRAYRAPCAGCGMGYESGERDITKAKCAVKVCCVTRGHETCVDCPDYESCEILGAFHGKTGYNYGKYRQALEYIRRDGYESFLMIAESWTGACGKYPPSGGRD